MDFWAEVLARLRPAPALDAGTPALWWTVAAAVAVVVLPGVWRAVRVLVTVVHELGHGLVGLAVGRTFTGLVLRPDMSGHAVTAGPVRGPGRLATTWAGYPAPALVGAGLVTAGGWGWAAPVLGAGLVLLAVGLLRVRSLYTAVAMLAVLAATAALWWSAPAAVQGLVLVGVGLVLVAGAWRHLGALLGARDRGSDPAVLARITPVPQVVWTASFVAVLGAATWWAGRLLLGLVR